MQGQRVCRMHGGEAPQAIAAAERRQADEQATVTLRRLWDRDAPPVTDPVLSLQRLAGALEAMVDQLGTRVNDLTGVSPEEEPARVRADVALLERLIGHLRGLLVDMARLGLEDRVTAVLEAQGEQVYELVQAIRRALLVELVGLLSEHPGALTLLEDGYERLFERVAYAELGARHDAETGGAA